MLLWSFRFFWLWSKWKTVSPFLLENSFPWLFVALKLKWPADSTKVQVKSRKICNVITELFLQSNVGADGFVMFHSWVVWMETRSLFETVTVQVSHILFKSKDWFHLFRITFLYQFFILMVQQMSCQRVNGESLVELASRCFQWPGRLK